MHRDTDSTRLIGESTGDSLSDPPRGIGREFESLTKVEFFYRSKEPNIPFLNEIEEREIVRPTDIFLRNRDNQT